MSLDVYLSQTQMTDVFEWNVTHNLTRMADEAGLYDCLWRPEEIGISKASQLVEPLKAGLIRLLAEPTQFKEFNPENGWGSYEGLVTFVTNYLAACNEFPDAEVRASR